LAYDFETVISTALKSEILFESTDWCCLALILATLMLMLASLWAPPGRLGHDFSPQPLFCYSFLMIECPIEILAGEWKEDIL